MPTADQTRIVADAAQPRALTLWRALRPLTSVIRFMQSGAHPDDEKSGMLAALAYRDGINLSYACSTRGEGGQNDIGTEAGTDLGALRTQEMERACDVLLMRMYWLSEGPDDPITDFGFSKSGTDTLQRWGHNRTLARFVDIVRKEKPDILCPTFLDVPGQHGHHRAMTQAAHDVMTAAADPDFASALPPWQVSKLYLPASSGAGASYDDTEPPPPTTLTLDGSGVDLVTGWSWERIGEQSRAFHRTQGMGRWVPSGTETTWPLHLAESHVPGPDLRLSSGLVSSVGDLANLPGAGPLAADLLAAQQFIDEAIAAFPDLYAVAKHATHALRHIRAAVGSCPEAVQGQVLHRLEAKDTQLCHVLRLALGIEAHLWIDEPFVVAGTTTPATLEFSPSVANASLSLDLPEGVRMDAGRLLASETALPTDPYPAFYDPAAPSAPALVVTGQTDGVTFESRLAFDTQMVILPARAATMTPGAQVVNLTGSARTITVNIGDLAPRGGSPKLETPHGWKVSAFGDRLDITLPDQVEEGVFTLPLTIDGKGAATVRRIDHSHVAPTATHRPAIVTVRTLRATLPQAHVGYIGAGNDRVDHWLRALGLDVTSLSVDDLGRPDSLQSLDTIVIGIFAMRFRAGLAEVMPELRGWVENGGTLVTLYHRPWDNWDPETVPPRRLEIGQPSLRWRVTDETADIRHLVAHDVLRYPNSIGPDDWAGWKKERGLYFARSWDPAYTSILEMADPEEDPHQGALLVADIGQGRHIHCALILHHQMEQLVPGAFRLMANLVAPRR